MPVGLLDLTTDNFNEGYPLSPDYLTIEGYVEEEYGDIAGQALYIVFENKFNPNPIPLLADGESS